MALVINGQRIEDSIIEGEFSEIKSYFERLGNVSCCERDPEFRGYARDNVIARVLLAQEAKRKMQPTPDAEVDASVAKLIDGKIPAHSMSRRLSPIAWNRSDLSWKCR